MHESAWVEPGVLNLDLTRQVAPLGLHFAPDPSSQQSCSIGGNIANNAGGPHCLKYGVTSTHVLALEVVLPDGEVTTLGGLDPEPVGLDLRGAFIGGEGTLGIATKIAVRLTPIPPVIRTLLIDFASMDDAAATVSAIIADGLVPAAIEMMDAKCTRAVEDFVHAGFPLDAAAVLIVELDGLADGVEAAAARVCDIAIAEGARTARIAADDAERALWWKGRKSAFGAIARIKPDYYLHDTVVPRTQARRGAPCGRGDCRALRAHRAQRLPRRRREPPSAARVRYARRWCARAGTRRGGGDHPRLGGRGRCFVR